MKFITLEALKIFKNNVENEVENKFKSMFDLIRPIGDTYVQYPQQKSPMDLWGTFSTWEVINYDGAFFRAEGTNANAFNGNKQTDSAPNITGKFIADMRVAYGIEGSFYYENGLLQDFKDSSNTRSGLVCLDASRSNSAYGRRNEVAPVNYTIRIWKRVR